MGEREIVEARSPFPAPWSCGAMRYLGYGIETSSHPPERFLNPSRSKYKNIMKFQRI